MGYMRVIIDPDAFLNDCYDGMQGYRLLYLAVLDRALRDVSPQINDCHSHERLQAYRWLKGFNTEALISYVDVVEILALSSRQLKSIDSHVEKCKRSFTSCFREKIKA